MTYTLFEFAKENAEDLLKNQPSAPVIVSAIEAINFVI
jgi:hypothetical protein